MTANEVASAPEGLLKHAESRSSAVVKKVRLAIKAIETEVEQNEGIYPFNKGRLTKNEVCRRAEINPMTLQAPAHRNTTNAMVNEFLDRVRSGMIQGRRSVRRTVTDRAEDWKRQHGLIANAYSLAMLDHNRDKAALRKANASISVLEKELAEVRRQLARASVQTVVPIKKGE